MEERQRTRLLIKRTQAKSSQGSGLDGQRTGHEHDAGETGQAIDSGETVNKKKTAALLSMFVDYYSTSINHEDVGGTR